MFSSCLVFLPIDSSLVSYLKKLYSILSGCRLLLLDNSYSAKAKYITSYLKWVGGWAEKTEMVSRLLPFLLILPQKLGASVHLSALYYIKCDSFVGFTHGNSSNQTVEFVFSVILKFCLCLNQLSSCRIYEKRRKSNHSMWKSDLKNPEVFSQLLWGCDMCQRDRKLWWVWFEIHICVDLQMLMRTETFKCCEEF